ncbi:MAG: hypothetical protein HYZ45_14825, partial [Burkholderiales bacterium]|nr:hypothetical protein [Burkholderiales bacterium]
MLASPAPASPHAANRANVIPAYGSDENGLVYGYLFLPETSGHAVNTTQALQWLADAEQTPHGMPKASEADGKQGQSAGFVWLHFNLANATTLSWMQQNLQLPPEFYETLVDGSRSTRVDFADDHLIGVLNDVLFDFSFDPSQVSTLVLCAGHDLLLIIIFSLFLLRYVTTSNFI